MSDNEMAMEIERLRAENAAMKAAKDHQIKLKVSEKGDLSLYGLQRFPVTLYREQWEKVIAMAPEITAFITANAAQLKAKE